MIVNPSTRLLFGRVGRFTTLRSQVCKYAKSAAEEQKAFWEKIAKSNRPLSPHLTIYRLPMTANMSILHRATGGYLAAVIRLAGLGAILAAGNFDKVVDFIQTYIHPHIWLTIKASVAFCVVYHTLTGLRHLMWDTGRGLKLAQLYKSGYPIIALALIGTAVLTFQ